MIGTEPLTPTGGSSDGEERTAVYDFPPRESRGIALGITCSQLAVLGTALLFGVLVVERLVPPQAGAYAVCISLAGGAALAFIPVRGHHAGEWATLLARYAVRPHEARRRGDVREIAHVLPRVTLHVHEQGGSARGVLHESHRAG